MNTKSTSPKRKRKIAVVAAALVAAASVGAYAYWTGTGSGTGTAATGTGSTVVVKQTSTVTNLAPGRPAQVLSGNFDNTSGNGSVYVTQLAVTLSVAKASGAPAGTCDATDYTLSSATIPVGQDVPAGTGVGSWGGASYTIAFNNKGTNQDACKGATVTVNYAAS